MAGIEMNQRLAYRLIAGAAVLGVIAGAIEISRTIAQSTDNSAASGTADAPRAAAPPAAPASPPPSGNPLWTIPLNQLSMTKERPILSPSRHPPPPPVVAPAYVAPVASRPPPKAKEPERPT